MAVNATAIWRVRPSGSNTNGGGYDPGIGGAATDYSQQNAAQASGSNATCTTGTSTFVDATANAFTSAMVGNAIWIASGTNFTVGAYFVTGFTSASTVTLDRSPVGGTNGSVGVWKLGGGWADFWTNTTSSNAIVPGNTVYILGSGTPNPSSYVYDYTFAAGSAQNVVAGTSSGYINYLNDPNTPSYKAPPDTTGGMPTVKWTTTSNVVFNGSQVAGLWLISGINNTTTFYGSANLMCYGCVWDALTFTGFGGTAATGGPVHIVGCEIFASSTGNMGNGFFQYSNGGTFNGCNFHDGGAGGNCFCSVYANSYLLNSIIAKSGTAGVRVVDHPASVINCTIDGNTTGIGINSSGILGAYVINNIISNTVSGNGINLESGTTAGNDRQKFLIDYNVFYNNSANYNLISAGAHDTALGVSPYVASGTENYQLA